ncbi:RNA polymerase sigma factor [Pseudarthrobacter sp. J1763]|uniref:RNA polymerase sigma factor n=1 Tax=Pseudarthrobacter sp. J1763 TaxID=3420445 RepID=UPI003D2677D5
MRTSILEDLDVYPRTSRRPSTTPSTAKSLFRLAWQKSELHPGIGWLLATARNVVGNEYKARERSQMLQERLQQEAMAAESEHNTNERALVAQVLEQLSEKEREVLMLSYWDDLTTIELAEALGCSPTAAGVRLHRARKSFAKHIPAQLAQERTA